MILLSSVNIVQIYFYGSIVSLSVFVVTILQHGFFCKSEKKIKQEVRRQTRAAGGKRAILKIQKPVKKLDQSRIDYTKLRSLLNKAKYAMAQKKWKDSERILIGALAIHPTSIDALSYLGTTYLKQNLAAKAALIYQKLIEIEPRNSSHYNHLGLSFFNQRKYEKAHEAYEQALKYDKKNPICHANLGRIFYQTKKYSTAAHYFQKACALRPRNTDYLFLLADTYLYGRDFENAKTVYQKIFDLEPYNEEAREKIIQINRRR